MTPNKNKSLVESEKEAVKCPVCGQKYDHKQEVSSYSKNELRKDAYKCVESMAGPTNYWYVHLDN